MALTLTVGTNTYVSRADATTYFEARLASTAWSDATTSDQDIALVMATRAIEAIRHRGRKADTDQALSFPRCYPRDDRYALTPSEHRFDDPPWPRMVCEDTVPQAVIDAVCEEALALLADHATGVDANTRAALQAAGVTSWRADDVAETYAPGGRRGVAALRSPTARSLLERYAAGAVSIR